MAQGKGGRPPKQFNRRQFEDLLGYGCSEEEICWFFRDAETGIPIHPDTINRWCIRTYGMGFKEFRDKNALFPLKIKLRQYQLDLAKKSAAMAIFLGKQYLGQSDKQEVQITATDDDTVKAMDEYFAKKAAGAKH